ncbi:MAG TPA: SMP-30/gluconolactonase/LRE family protein [Pseudonocardiaceae bacterium]|nr:SMP-30/gluconolactonase/LRE family protein [Pseudonocardiaceae bacterium]
MPRPMIAPVVWTPPSVPPRATEQVSKPPMPDPDLIAINSVGPEDVVLDEDGNVFTGVADGRILRLTPEGVVTTVADTGGRPLGVELAGDGRLVICDAHRGLLRVDPALGTVETLVDTIDGTRMRLCDNSAVGPDGSIYFSDSSRRFGLDHWQADLLEHSGTGRLLCRTPNGKVEVLADGLQFANGVALSTDGSFVAVAETGAYRISRVWLTGPKAGQHDVLIDNLPGFPDNISTGTDGRLWVAIASPRNPVLDWAHARSPLLRKAIWAMPHQWQPKPKRTAWVLAVDATGKIVADLQSGGDRYHLVTGVREHNGKLYLGSLAEQSVAVLALPQP